MNCGVKRKVSPAIGVFACVFKGARYEEPSSKCPSRTKCASRFPAPWRAFGPRALDLMAVPNRVGLAFVLLGRELPDGSTIFYGAGGFYPQTLKHMLSGPGHVDYTVDDMTTDIDFRAKITAAREREVKYVMNNWNEKQYNVAGVSLVKHVGKLVGLDVGDPKSMEMPDDVVKLIKNENDPDRPLRFAITEGYGPRL